MRLIGINGFKRSGKGETGRAIDAALYENFQTTTLLGFADKLKILAAKTLGFKDLSDTECIALMDECKEEWIFSILKTADEGFVSETGGFFPMVKEYEWHRLTGREYLQNLGNEARTVFGEDFWVDQVLPDLTRFDGAEWLLEAQETVAADYDTDAVVFTDLRYPNEAQRVLDLGGEVWEVVRPGLSSDGHASETPLPRELVSRVIYNSSDLSELRFQVEKALVI